MTDERYLKLIQQLRERTRNGAIHWQPLGDSTSEFVTALATYSVTIGREERLGQQEDDYRIRLRDDTGRTIDEFVDGEVPKRTEERPFIIMRELFDLARRDALGVDQALDEILGELGQRVPF